MNEIIRSVPFIVQPNTQEKDNIYTVALQKKKSKCMVTGRRNSSLLAVSGKADLHC